MAAPMINPSQLIDSPELERFVIECSDRSFMCAIYTDTYTDYSYTGGGKGCEAHRLIIALTNN